MKRSLQEWFAFYESKTGDVIHDTLKGSPNFMFDAYKGFCAITINDDCVHIDKMCGCGKHWRSEAEAKAKESGLTVLRAACVREIKPFLRAFGFLVLAEHHENGKHHIACQDELGRKVVAVSHGVKRNGEAAYTVTQYLI